MVVSSPAAQKFNSNKRIFRRTYSEFLKTIISEDNLERPTNILPHSAKPLPIFAQPLRFASVSTMINSICLIFLASATAFNGSAAPTFNGSATAAFAITSLQSESKNETTEPDVPSAAATPSHKNATHKNATHENATEPAAVLGRTNRLSRESSPYLLLHAHNPVDWYPWGAEAFEKAKEENKLIFLSVGYSSCYWCHVMERLVFSNQKIASFMNKHFINVKVDREERPDVDEIYMTSLIVYQQASGTGGGGGWPLSLFLTPEGNPIAGATYLPPEDTADGRIGFLSAANQVNNLWINEEGKLRGSADLLASEVRRLTGPQLVVEQIEPSGDLVRAAIDEIIQHYDPEFGGVDFKPSKPNSPRFPQVPRLQLLLASYNAQADPELLKVITHSLTAMARGGIRDHLGGGFHRYSTDRQWHVPHFEKMLYDQAQLLQLYVQAALITKEPLFAEVAAEIADFVKRELTLPDGGFCSALDAETNTIEGEYYVWSPEQMIQILGQTDADLFMATYGMKNKNPFEHGYVLHLPASRSTAGNSAERPSPEFSDRIASCKTKLLAARNLRERPLLDDKVLTEWNAMMIEALAVSSQLPGRESDLVAAKTAADFLLQNLRKEDGTLYRSWRQGRAVYEAYLDDYAFLVSALIQLHKVTDEAKWLNSAEQLVKTQIDLFYDQDLKTFFYTSRHHEKLIARTSSAYDSTFASGGSVTIRNLQQLQGLQAAVLTFTSGYTELADAALSKMLPVLKQSPAACAGVALALHHSLLENPSAVRLARPAGIFARDILLTSANPANQSFSKTDQRTTDAQKTDSNAAGSSTLFKPVFPEPNPSSDEEKKERPIQAKIYPMFDKLERGGKCPIAVQLIIDKPWHINANPSNPDFLVPTELKVSSKQKIKMTLVKYPEHELLKVDGEPNPYHVYGGTVTIYGLLEIDPAEAADFGELEIRINYQACNDGTCLKPDKIVLKGKLPLINPGEPIREINKDKFPKPRKPANAN